MVVLLAPPLFIPIIAMCIALAITILLRRLRERLKNKKVMLYGPQNSGKTLLATFISTGKIPEKPVANPFKEEWEWTDKENSIHYTFNSMGGAQENLYGGRMELLYKENDIILMLFSVSQYISDMKYKDDVNCRFDALVRLYEEAKKPMLIIGSYRDKLDQDQQEKYKSLVNLIDREKTYFSFLIEQEYILSNLTDEKDLLDVIKKIKELI